ncbi:probable E3 ubiquitin-protein ligase HERC3 isoform X2 [Acanthopagrus latus]|uniref:probable E3 ubiquitin-protein ligase HERC3 isoform X2 n=1 Tax=Acanthopagrus latus TaxID=8177 RepID=UPI00187C60B7|nr:probable E3 ubiquitin-protein ligase HERC3 isoform X2 [Acanthopagrus latus]
MFSWGEHSLRGFRLRHGALADSHRRDADGDDADCDDDDDGVQYADLGYHITDLSAGHSVLAFCKSNGNSFIIRTNESQDGRRVRGKQKFVQCKEKIVAVSCGDDTVTLLSDRGNVLCVDTAHTYIPRPVEALSNITVSQVACGSRHSVALTKDGQVYTWGQDSRGQLGLGKRKLGASSPQHLRSLSALPLVQVSAGGEQSFALSVSGGVFGWGRNDCGQLGLGDRTDRHTPTAVQCLNLKKTVHISCGKDHTVTLTKTGAVFTFGSGQHGQLGHNSFCDELRPRLVAELWGAKVTKITCGRHHTLVLTDSKRIYSFGRGEEGQLGHGEESHPSVPLPVKLPRDSADDPKITNIFVGGNCSFAICTSDEEVHDESDITNSVAQHCLDSMVDKWIAECNSKSWKKIKQEIHRTFSSASCVNKSFLEQSKDKHFLTSPKYSGLKLSLARRAFKKLVKKDDVIAEVEAAVQHLLPSLDRKPVGVEGLRIHLLLMELLYVIQRHKRQETSTRLAEAVAAAVLRLSDDSLQVIGDWWSSLSPSTMVKHVKVWKQALSAVLSFKPVPRNSGVRNLLLVLQYMYNANCRIAEPQRLPESDFNLLIDKEFLREDVLFWRSRLKRKKMNAEPLILCSFPIVMDLQSKKLAFDINANSTKWETIFQIICSMPFEYGFPLPQDVFFEMDLRRAAVLEDTFKQMATAHHTDYKMPLVVYFDKNRTIDNLCRKDFFYKVFHDLVSLDTGMFMFNDNETLAWFPSKATQEDQRYFQFGVLCGLALYNGCIIHLPFPLALFKKLLGVKPSLQDLLELSPVVGVSLQYILEDCQDDDLENLEMDFVISWDGTEIDLDPKNPEKPVTSENKKEFVEAYVNHVFNTSVEGVFEEFKRGFFQVCDRDLVKLFRPKELQEVLVGKDLLDWAKLKQNTVYEGGYHPDHPTIQMFWEVFDELNEDQKKAFLWFVTGFERVPILGMETIEMKVGVVKIQDLSYDQYYPQTHTCFSTLELPLYSTKEIMQTKLIEALSNSKDIYK